jgi:hypothetical protein
VQVSLEPIGNVPGLPKPNGNLPGDQGVLKLELATQKSAPAGEHAVLVKVKGKFGNVNFDAEAQSSVLVEPAG